MCFAESVAHVAAPVVGVGHEHVLVAPHHEGDSPADRADSRVQVGCGVVGRSSAEVAVVGRPLGRIEPAAAAIKMTGHRGEAAARTPPTPAAAARPHSPGSRLPGHQTATRPEPDLPLPSPTVPPCIQHGPPAAVSTTYGGRAVVVFPGMHLPGPGTVTASTRKINKHSHAQTPPTRSTTDTTPTSSSKTTLNTRARLRTGEQGRPLGLAPDHRLHPTAPGPGPDHRSAPPLGEPTALRPAHPARVRRAFPRIHRDGRGSGQSAETLPPRTWTLSRRHLRTCATPSRRQGTPEEDQPPAAPNPQSKDQARPLLVSDYQCGAVIAAAAPPPQ